MKTIVLFATSLVLALPAFVQPARGATTVITSGTDAELRAAVAACDVITFNFDGVIALTNSITVSCAVTIDASGHAVTLSGGTSNRLFNVLPGASLTLLHLTLANGRAQGAKGANGSPTPFPFNGQPGQSVDSGGLKLSGATLFAADCTFSNCVAVGGNGGDTPFPSIVFPGAGGTASGGLLDAQGSSIVFSNCIVVRNFALGGQSGTGGSASTLFPSTAIGIGGVFAVTQGDLTLVGCTLAGNYATIAGGALYNNGSSILISNCVFNANSAGPTIKLSAGSGGALAQVGGTLRAVDSLFSSNTVSSHNGSLPPSGGSIAGGNASGGVASITGGTALVERCTFENNSAIGGAGGSQVDSGSGSGGALYSQAIVNITNSTFAHNFATPGPRNAFPDFTSRGRGGAVATAGGTSQISFTTLASNYVQNGASHNNPSVGGALDVSGGSLFVGDTILAGNTVNGSSSNTFGTIGDLGHNISSDASPAWTSGTSSNNTDPLLLPLANNGGPTLTMALRSGSPALNSASSSGPATDQRGAARPSGIGFDIGAYEGAGTPTLLIRRGTGGTHFLSWLAEGGRTYRIDVAHTFADWSPFATNVVAANGWVDFPVTNASPAFFRLLAE
jgi:hypothetical protein